MQGRIAQGAFQHAERKPESRLLSAVKAPLQVRRVVPSSRRDRSSLALGKRLTQPNAHDERRCSGLPGENSKSCADTPHASSCMSCWPRPPATTRHRVRASLRRAATRERRVDVASQPRLGSCEGTTAKKREGVMDSATRTQKRCRQNRFLLI